MEWFAIPTFMFAVIGHLFFRSWAGGIVLGWIGIAIWIAYMVTKNG